MAKRTKERDDRHHDGHDADPVDPVEVVRLEFGRFPEVDRLNPRFVPERERLKLTLDVRTSPHAAQPTAASLLEPLGSLLPNLRRHRCGDASRISEITLKRTRVGDPTGEDAADVAHLIEHIIIDFQHSIAEMRTCSGVTCGYETPVHRYDVFVESPGQRVSRLCIALACEMMNGLLKGSGPDPLYDRVVRLAQRLHRQGCLPLPDIDEQLSVALRVLRDLRFAQEMKTSINFSSVPVYCMIDDNNLA
jgi:hypothetical protein